jgi:protein SCO1
MLSQNSVALQGGTLLPAPRELDRFELTDLDGKPFGPAQLAGSPGLLFLGFTYCPDVCPTTLATLRDVLAAAPVPGLRVLFVTVDPERDDAATLARYLAAFDSRFVGLRGEQAALAPFLRTLGAIAVRQPLPGGSYTMDHTATLYLLDRRGRLAAVFSPPFDAATLRADLARAAPLL